MIALICMHAHHIENARVLLCACVGFCVMRISVMNITCPMLFLRSITFMFYE